VVNLKEFHSDSLRQHYLRQVRRVLPFSNLSVVLRSPVLVMIRSMREKGRLVKEITGVPWDSFELHST
jgi:hypothetical protein